MWITNYSDSIAFNFDKVTGIKLDPRSDGYFDLVFFGEMMPGGAIRMGPYTVGESAEIFRNLMESRSSDRVYRLPTPEK